jgi:ankyrin repeat protein
MNKHLPTRPHIDHLRAEAKELLRSTTDISQLAAAQHLVAQNYGFANWAELRTHVEAVTIARLDPGNWLRKADLYQWIEPHANQERDWWLSLANGDVGLVSEKLGEKPDLANEPGGPLDRYPLHYVSCLWVRSLDAPGCVRELLKFGADPNALYFHADFPDSPLSVLWGAVGIKHNFELSRLLLEAGANPNDNESLYHCVEHDEPEILQLLIDHGVDVNSFNGLARALDFDRLRQVEMLLEAGADPNTQLGSESMIHHAIRRGRTLPFIELLIKHGGDLKSLSNDRLTVLQHAALRGDWPTFVFLRELTGDLISDEFEFVAQVRGGQPVTAAKPPQLSFASLSLLGLAVFNGQREPAMRMLDAGWPIDARYDGSTPLHCACFIGDAEMVKVLIERGAPLDVIDGRFRSSPLGWALYGEVHSQMPRGDYEQCVRLMIEAGCAKPQSDWTASDDMKDVLAEYGY